MKSLSTEVAEIVSLDGARVRHCSAVLPAWPVLVLAATLLSIVPLTAGAQHDSLWSGVRSGSHVVLMRHAEAPGVGDPDVFALGDCSTQRNLSTQGRDQAARIGERFRARGISRAKVFSSQWCRCLDTAQALALGPVLELPVLNSFFRDFSREERQTRALRQWIIAQPPVDGPLVLVTHQVNITALTDVYPASGELVIVEVDDAGAVTVAGRIRTD